MQGGLLLDAVVTQGAPVLQLRLQRWEASLGRCPPWALMPSMGTVEWRSKGGQSHICISAAFFWASLTAVSPSDSASPTLLPPTACICMYLGSLKGAIPANESLGQVPQWCSELAELCRSLEGHQCSPKCRAV